VLRDVAIDLSARRGRTILLLLAVALSCGVLMASTATTVSAARQIDADLAAASTSLLTVTGRAPDPGAADPTATDPNAGPQPTFPADAEGRAATIGLVAAAGRRVDVAVEDAAPSRLDPHGGQSERLAVQVIGVTSPYLRAAGVAQMPPTAWMLDEEDGRYPVAYLGAAAAELLGVPEQGPHTARRLWVDGRPYEVIGILTAGPDVSLDRAIVLPYAVALTLPGVSEWTTQFLVRTQPGAGAPVAAVIREAVRPDNPAALDVSAVNDFRDVRTGVDSQLARLSAGIGALLLALSALIIANSMVVSVVARTTEIGLRRALGASSRSVAAVFLTEGALVGALGGLSGSALGMGASVTIAALQGWTHHFSLLLALAGPVLGLSIGLLASAYPALRAARVAPSEALRSD
jgi:putative ABC transport system permease protein